MSKKPKNRESFDENKHSPTKHEYASYSDSHYPPYDDIETYINKLGNADLYKAYIVELEQCSQKKQKKLSFEEFNEKISEFKDLKTKEYEQVRGRADKIRQATIIRSKMDEIIEKCLLASMRGF